MREIKFRAWDIKNEIMTPAPMSKVYRNKYSLFGDIYLLEKDAFEDTVRVELMQYTGLKDKNGVEIYEGDVVHKTYSNNLTATGEVIYDSATYFVREVEGYAFLHGGHDGEKIEVIGNIYENPKLLESTSL